MHLLNYWDLLWTFFKFVIYFDSCQAFSSGRSKEGPGGPPPYFWTKLRTEKQKKKKCLRPVHPPYLRVWMTAPPPPPLSEGFDPPLFYVSRPNKNSRQHIGKHFKYEIHMNFLLIWKNFKSNLSDFTKDFLNKPLNLSPFPCTKNR